MTTPENTLRVDVPDPGPSFRGALKERDFRLFFTGQLSSEVGNGLVQLALPWLVLQLTGSAFQLGAAYFFFFLPILIFGIPGGVFVDRWDRRLTIVVVDGIRAIAFLSVAVIYYTGGLTVAHLYAVIFLESALQNFFNPARTALMPNLVKQDDLRAANSLIEVSRTIGFMVAVPAGGWLVELLGPAAVFLVDGVTFAISAVTVFFIQWRPGERIKEVGENFWHSSAIMFQESAAGVATIGKQKLLQVSVLLGLALNIVIAPIQVLLPLFVFNIKGNSGFYFSLLVGGLLIGLLIGSLTAPANARRLGLGRLTILAVCVLGVVVAISTWPPTLWPPVIGMLIAGICIGSLNVAQTTMLQSSTTDEERGRVSATYFTATNGIRPLSFLAMGALASAVTDVRFLFVALGVVALGVGAVLARSEEVRNHA